MPKRVLGLALTILGLFGIVLVIIFDNIFADVFGLLLGFMFAALGIVVLLRNWPAPSSKNKRRKF